MIKIEIPRKIPSYNEYTNACRSNKFKGAEMKKQIENDICWYLHKLPKIHNPIKIHFIWVEANKKRDLDNICFAKKFFLDAMQKCGIIENDNAKHVCGFTDTFEYGDEYKVILEIEEINV